MTTVQIISGDFNISNPSWPRYALWRPGRVFTSDEFTTAQSGAGELTDAGLGGGHHPWFTADGWEKSNGLLVHTSRGNRLMETPSSNVLATVKVSTHDTQHPWSFAMRRTGDSIAGGLLQFMVYPENVELRETLPGQQYKLLRRVFYATKAGDTLGFQHDGGIMTLTVNGEMLASEPLSEDVDQTLQGRHMGFTTIASQPSGATFESFSVTAL